MSARLITLLHNRLDKWRLCLLVFAIAYGYVLTINLSYMSMEWDEAAHFTGGLLLSRGQVGQWVWTNSFYPPAFDVVTSIFFFFGGVSVFAARFVSVTFSVISLLVIYEIANKMYNAKTALLATALFSVMPGIIWLSRMAMIETMLIFIFSLSMFFFFNWLTAGNQRDRIISFVALAIGVAVKYQMIVVVPIIMLVCMYFWKRDYLRADVKKYLQFPGISIILAVVAAMVVVVYALYSSGFMSTLLYAIQVGTADKAMYSVRYPLPVFYFIEMTWSNRFMHPVSLLLYLVALAGIGLFCYRRKFEDKFLLLWFAVVFMVFTLIPNREWRYVTIVFPVLAIATSSLLLSSFGKIQKFARTAKSQFARKWGTKLAAAGLIAFTVVGVSYSCVDAYTWIRGDQIQVPMEQAAEFAAQNLAQNQTLMVACPLNRFNKNMLWFYLNARTSRVNQNQTLQYPQLAVDAYTPTLKMTEFVSLCEENRVRDVLLYENGANRYFNSTLTAQDVFDLLIETSRFTLQITFGTEPHRVFVFAFGQSGQRG